MKRIVLLLIFTSLLCVGCANNNGLSGNEESHNSEETVADNTVTDDNAEDNMLTNDKDEESGDSEMFGSAELEYLKENFDIDPEYVEGIDLVSMFEDYQIFSRDYTKEEIIDIIETDRDYYKDTGKTEILSVFKLTSDNSYAGDSTLVKVAFDCNAGTEERIYVYDFNTNTVFYNDAVIAINDEVESQLIKLVDDCKVTSWDAHYEGEEELSTGSLGWKIVLVYANGECCVYDGYTGDGTHLPNEFSEFNSGIRTITKELM